MSWKDLPYICWQSAEPRINSGKIQMGMDFMIARQTFASSLCKSLFSNNWQRFVKEDYLMINTWVSSMAWCNVKPMKKKGKSSCISKPAKGLRSNIDEYSTIALFCWIFSDSTKDLATVKTTGNAIIQYSGRGVTCPKDTEVNVPQGVLNKHLYGQAEPSRRYEK